MKDNKKKLILTIVAVLALIAIVVGATYAYFAADLGGGTNANLNATTGTTDSLSFSTGDRIRIHADLDNFKAGEENLSDDTTATATLKPNNTTNQAEAKYNIFFIIDDNDFKYTTEDKTPELILKVTDPEGNVVTSITGLKGTDGEFDITTRTGAYLIAKDYVITTDKAEGETQSWKVEVTLINLDSNQNANMGKSLNGTIYITTEDEDTYKLPEINKLDAETTYSTITATLEVTEGTTEIDKYYFGKEEVNNTTAMINTSLIRRLSNTLAATDEIEYIETTNPSYEFTDLKDNAKYKIYCYAIDKNGMKSNTYEAEITTDEYELPSIDSVTKEVTADSIKVVVTASKGDNEISKYYYSSDNGATYTEGLTSNEYTFIELEAGTEYKIKIQVEDTIGRKSTEYYEGITTEASGYHGNCNDSTFVCQIAKKYGKDSSMYFHNGTIKSEDGTILDAEDNSYRYSGENPNNYVCFGSTATTCPANSLYRIIGIFNLSEDNSNPEYQIKLVKNTSLGNYQWSNSESNVWSNSTLNKNILNGTYLNGLGTTWSNMIATHIWQVGGMTEANAKEVPKTVYDYEVGINRASETYEAKIGLMYVSDYGYAATAENWTLKLSNYNIDQKIWITLLGDSVSDRWTISRYSSTTNLVFYTYYNLAYNIVTSSYTSVNPVFYLDSSVEISSGSGTSTDPYRLTI